MSNSFLKISNLDVEIEGKTILKNLNLQLDKGRIATLMGPSGSGKTSLLRTISGFISPSCGTIELNNIKINELPAEQRKIGMVFQDYALFPHITVHQNICFGSKNIPSHKLKTKCADFLDMLGLVDYADQYPYELSGGQQQKIAIARALMPNPDLILMDEPFSNLDLDNRDYLVKELYEMLKEQNTTVLVVTHDQNDAYMISDDIAILDNKEIAQFDEAYKIYHQPKNKFVADFIGKGQFINAKIKTTNSVECAIGILTADTQLNFAIGSEVELLVRPEDVVHDDSSQLKALIVNKVFRGFDYVYELELEDKSQILISINSHHLHKIGEKIGIIPNMEHVMVYAK